MNRIFARSVCRILILWLAAFPCSSYAGMIATDQVLAAAPTQDARATLRNLVRRGDVSSKLQGLGISPGSAPARVDAMTDAEVADIAGRIDSLPAGGASWWALIIGLLVIELIIYFWID